MHPAAMKIGKLFFETYWENEFRTILDVGSRNVNGTLRTVAPNAAEYVGIDLQDGPGVDKVLTDPYEYPFPDGSIDCIVSTSCYEHDRMFWLTFLESCRVLSDRGFIYINAPSGGHYHAYPYDHWRFYPDAGVALEFWARRMNAPVSLVESFLIPQSQSPCADCTMIFTKRGSFSPVRYLADEVAGSKNVRKNFNIQIDVERMQPSDKVFEWCLDFPQTSEASQPFTDVSADGWLIPSSSVLSGSFLLRSEGDRSQSFPFSIQRPDVIEAILKQSPEDHPLLMCGFSCPIPARLSVFELLWTVDGEDEILAKISVSRASA